MKVGIGILLCAVVFPLSAFAHAEIFFPRLLSPSELANTGFVLLNVDPTIATVNYYLLSPTGVTLSRPPAVQIPPGGQLAKLGSEMFPDAASPGWVYVITDTEGMQAFWLNYDAGLTFLDGAEASQLATIGADQVIPLVAGDTELNIISLNGVAVPVTMRLFGTDRELAPAFIRSVPIAGAFQTKVSQIFPSVDMAQARYMRLKTPGAPIAATALIKGFQVPAESAVVNGVNANSGTEMIFPHIVNGALTGADYTTIIGVTNLSASIQTVTITFNPNEGDPIVVPRVLAGNGALRETAQELFGLPSGFQTGWLRVNGTEPITGFAAYADNVAGALAVVPATTPQTSLFFSHIADGAPQWQTGLALLNTSGNSANAEVYAVTAAGSLIGKTTITIEPGKKIANVIHELIPQARGVNGGFVYVRSTNNVPLHGIELFYTTDLKVLSNVAAGKLAPGVVYAPPQ